MSTYSSSRSVVGAILSAIRSLLITLGVVTLLFAALNVAAYYALSHAPAGGAMTVFHYVIPPESTEGTAVLKRVFKTTSSKEALSRGQSAPSFEMHPGLHYMTARTANQHYRVGIEGVRYDAQWTDEQVRALLSRTEGLVFLMGGSTVLGHGVSGNETISWYMNRALTSKSSQVILNFGAQAYDQQRELDKLVYLLRAGYRPGRVILLDGWNDVVMAPRSNMRRQDKIVFHGFSTNRGEIAFTPGTRMGAINHARLFLESMPIFRFLEREGRSRYSISDVTSSRDPFLQGFDFFEADWVYNNWEQYTGRNVDDVERQLIHTLRNNIEFLKRQAEAFGFVPTVLLQPMGFFDPKNPFVTPAVRDQFGYRVLLRLRDTIRKEIALGNLKMIDLTDALNSIVGDRYVDIAHYTPEANAELAKRILAVTGEDRRDRISAR